MQFEGVHLYFFFLKYTFIGSSERNDQIQLPIGSSKDVGTANSYGNSNEQSKTDDILTDSKLLHSEK